MIAPTCKHQDFKSVGSVRGVKRFKCCDCGVTFAAAKPKPLGDMRVDLSKAKLALRMLTEGMSIRSTERTTGIHRDTLCKLVVLFGTACRKFLDDRMHGLKLTHIVMHRTPTPDAETEADRFAAEFLMPEREIKSDLRNLTIPKAAALKLQWRVAMQAIIRRARDTGAITSAKYQSLCVRISQLGYRKNEPNPIEPESPKMLQRIVQMYLGERNYSISELSAASLCEEQEFRETFLCSEQPTLRVVK